MYLRKTICIYAFRFQLLQHFFSHLGMLGREMVSIAKKSTANEHSDVEWWHKLIFHIPFVVLEKLLQTWLMLQAGLVSTGLRGAGVLMSDLLCVQHNVDITTCSWH